MPKTFKPSKLGWRIWYHLCHIPATHICRRFGWRSQIGSAALRLEYAMAQLLHVVPE